MQTVWNDVKTALKEVMDAKNFSLWIKPLEFLDADERTVYIGCPNKFSRNWVQENYSSLFQSQLSNVGWNDHKVIFKTLPQSALTKRNHNGGNGNKKQLILPNMPKK